MVRHYTLYASRKTDAILFSINDKPVMEKLGFRREVALEGSGHQAVAA